MPIPRRLSQYLPWFLYTYLVLSWGSSFILIKQGLIAFTPFQLAGLRIVISGLVMLPFILGRAKELSRMEWRYILFVGLIGNAIPAFLFPLAETRLNSASAGVLNTLSPLFVLMLGLLFFQLQPGREQKLGMLVGFSGALILILMGGGVEIDLWSNAAYSLLVVLATICYGLSTNIMKRFLNTTPSMLATGFALLAMAIPYSIYLVFSGIENVFVKAVPEVWWSFASIAVLAAFGTAFALVCFYRLVQITDPIFSSSVTYVIPIVALLWGLIAGEKIYPGQYAGMGLVLLGVYLVNRKPQSKAKPVPLPKK